MFGFGGFLVLPGFGGGSFGGGSFGCGSLDGGSVGGGAGGWTGLGIADGK